MKTSVTNFRTAIWAATAEHSEAQRRFLYDSYFDFATLSEDVVENLMNRVFKCTTADEITSFHIDGMQITCIGDHSGSGTRVTSFGDGEVIGGVFLCAECAEKSKR